MAQFELADRSGLPDALRVLLQDYPRAGWEDDPGFDGLVRFWLDRHLMFRRLLAELTQSSEAMLDQTIDARRYLATVSRYGGMLVNGLHEHHVIEDTHYFPKLAQQDARIEKGFAILDRDHHALDAHLSAFVASANAVISAAEAASKLQDAVGAFHGQLAELHRLLDRHLVDEEELIVPIILRYGAPDMG